MNGEFGVLTAAGVFLGGLGLFMLGVSMITDGLKIAAGSALRDILARSTRTPWHGMASGAVFTALVQSSSAVTVATIGFVNAGLLGIAAALSIVLGATIGTTMTGWLVSAVGFQFKITAFALPLLGIGMFLRLVGPSRRSGAIGEALAGFGLFFIGVDFLREAFEGMAQNMDIASLYPGGLVGVLIFLGLGLLMTVLTQSSSAAIAIILTAASGGLVSFAAAASAVIGATIGTTSTSALAVIGATSNARRVAAGHVIINGFNAMVGIALLPLVIWLVADNAELQQIPAFTLAIFHTSFNIAGVLLLRPFIGQVAVWLGQKFRTEAETLGRPQFLDRNIMVSPALAIDAFLLELQRMAGLARGHALAALSYEGPPGKSLQRQHDGIRQLVQQVEHFVGTLEAERLGASVASQLPLVLRISNYIDETVALAQDNAENDADVEYLLQSSVGAGIADFQARVQALIDLSDVDAEDFNADSMNKAFEQLQLDWKRLKTELLDAGVRREIPMIRLNPAIDSLRTMLRVAERFTRIAIRLTELKAAMPSAAEPVVISVTDSEPDPGSETETAPEKADSQIDR